MEKVNFNYGQKTINDFNNIFKDGTLNLEPAFQRNSVWSLSDRQKLILSIMQDYPIPSIFLYKHGSDGGKLKYDVIDGKQRLESILMFQGLGKFRKNRFSLKGNIAKILGDLTVGSEELNWKMIQKRGLEHRITGYNIQTAEVSDAPDIMDLFVRINSTGKRLTGAEIRHAKFITTDFMKQAFKLGEKWKKYFAENRILKEAQIARMKHIELVCELMASINAKRPIDRKVALERILEGNSIKSSPLKNCAQELNWALNITKHMFAELRTTRFANAVDFYTLCLFIWEMNKEKCILNDKRRNRQAQTLLVWLSDGVDAVRKNIGEIESIPSIKTHQNIFTDYLSTIQGHTDSVNSRQRRAEILARIFGGLFARKEKNRNFTIEQRRLIWHSEKTQKCIGCKKPLTWENFTIDHIKPYSRGGKTKISNAALMCRKCNSKKGAHKG